MRVDLRRLACRDRDLETQNDRQWTGNQVKTRLMGQSQSVNSLRTTKRPNKSKYQCISRHFTIDVITQELYASKHRCRACGLTVGLMDMDAMGVMHIYPASTKPQHQRCGGDPIRRDNDSFVSSFENALCVCLFHYGEFESKKGLQKYSVEYLQGLKQGKLTLNHK